MPKSHLLNANIHRAKEGARVLEDIARFLLRDEALFHRIREVRHCIQLTAPIYDANEDLGGTSLVEDNVRHHLISIIQANAMRLQEALRVLEEMAETASQKQSMKALRYKAYDLHATLYYSARKYLKWDLLQGLYLIIDTDVIPHPITEIVAVINQSPIKVVQYRNKSATKRVVAEQAHQIKQRLDPNKLFIINDHIDIALDCGDGIHLGQDDYPLARIRNIIPEDFILGISCHNSIEARIAMQYNPSYIAMGCLFETKSKHDIISTSIDELIQVCNETTVPVCAIGGINMHNLDQALTANIKMAALISFVWQTDNPLQTIRQMHEKITNASG